MNAYVQENLRKIGMDVELIPIEWNAPTVWVHEGFGELTLPWLAK